MCDKIYILIKINSSLTHDKRTKKSTCTAWSIVSNKEEARNLSTSHVQMQKRRFSSCSSEWFLRNHDWKSMSEDWNWSSSTFLVHLTKSHHKKIQYLINEQSTWITNRTKLENRGLLGLKMCLVEVDWVTWNLASPSQPFW